MKKGILLVVLLTIAACGGQPAGPDLGSPFISGNIALNLYLQDGIPPPTVFDGGDFPFSVGVVLENVGESDVGPGTDNPFLQLRLEGLLPSSFGITDADLIYESNEMLLGAKKNYDGTILPGQFHNYVYEQLSYQKKLLGNQEHTLRVNACYDYTNKAIAQLCMKDDIVESVQDSTICTLTGLKPVANSGGPIHVTEVVQNPLAANKIQVNLKIEHVGIGEFYGRSAEETCDPDIRNTNKYLIDVKVETDDSGATVLCHRFGGESGSMRMYSGSPQVLTCIIEGSSTVTRLYQTSLNVEIGYRYSQFIEQTFIIQAVPEY